MKMTMFIKAVNPIFLEILKNGPFIPQKEIPEATVGTEVVPAYYIPKEPSKWTEVEREKVALDIHLQLIIIDSMDMSMFGNIAACVSANEMWDHIEVLCEGT